MGLELVGGRLFGRGGGLRLRVFAWILELPTTDLPKGESREFNATEVAKVLGVLSPQVAGAIDVLVDLGMIRKHERKRGNEAQNYSRIPSPFWSIIATALSAVDQSAQTDAKTTLGTGSLA